MAWTSLPTADAAVEWLLRRLHEAEHRLSALHGEVTQEVDDAGRRCRDALAQASADTAEAGEQAQGRSTAARRRRRLQLRIACAALAVAVVVLSVVLASPVLLVGLVVPVLVLAAVELWWRSPTNRRSRVSSRDDDFTQVLARLHAVRDELRTTTSPERVGVLRTLAGELVADGERLLGVHLHAPAPAAVGAPPEGPPVEPAGGPTAAPTGDGDGARRLEPARPVEEQEPTS